jgi:hypothetical protein
MSKCYDLSSDQMHPRKNESFENFQNLVLHGHCEFLQRSIKNQIVSDNLMWQHFMEFLTCENMEMQRVSKEPMPCIAKEPMPCVSKEPMPTTLIHHKLIHNW